VPDEGARSHTAGGVIDAHHHVWDLTRRPQPWLAEPGLGALRRSFSTSDLVTDSTAGLCGRKLTATVLVQCLPLVAETEEFLRLAEQDQLVAGVVGWVDLTDPGMGGQLDRLRTVPGGQLLVGVRHLVQAESDPNWLLRKDVRRSLDEVAQRGLCYDLLILPHQLAAAATLAAEAPHLRLVLDHAAKPPLRSGDLGEWTKGVRSLSAAPQVVCKFSGLITEADHQSWSTKDLRPVAKELLEDFGPNRLMFGSDWPVCRVAGGWAAWASAAEELLAPLLPADLDQVLQGTARRTYGLSWNDRVNADQ
jgi:predicted TIM-barrel fold metal-dependent hydrolase